MKEQSIDPSLSDIFKTALATAPAPEDRQPSIVVNGDSNVVSFGGTVHIRETRRPRVPRAAT